MIEFQLTENDFIAFSELASARLPTNPTKNALAWAGIIAMAMVLIFQRNSEGSNALYLWLIWLPIIAGVWFVVIRKWQKEATQKAAKQMALEVGRQSLSFDSNQIRLVSAKADTTFDWSSISAYSISRGLLILWQSASQGIAIPESALDSHQAKFELLELLNSKAITQWA